MNGAIAKKAFRFGWRARLLTGALAIAGLNLAWGERPMPGPIDAPPDVVITAAPQPAPATIGALRVLGVTHLWSADRRFGGLSDFRLSQDGDILAISDQGYWVTAPRLAALNTPIAPGEHAITITAMRDSTGAVFATKNAADAEGLAILPGGRALVSFEGRHRLDVYDLPATGFAAGARPGPVLAGAERLGRNSGLEALALLPDGRIIAGAESGELWIAGMDAPSPTPRTAVLPLPFGFALTAIATIGDQAIMTWRSFNPATREIRIDIRQCTIASLEAGRPKCGRLALLAPPFPVDNIEGINARFHPDGIVLDLLSDDNYSGAQQTLLISLLWPSQPIAQ